MEKGDVDDVKKVKASRERSLERGRSGIGDGKGDI